MNCHCGARVYSLGIIDGCQVYKCISSKCGQEYRLPLVDRLSLPPYNTTEAVFQPASAIPTSKEYCCKEVGCGSNISKDQAMRTFDKYGIALCPWCEAKRDGG